MKFKQFLTLKKSSRIYLDYASITPVDKEVSNELARVLRDYPANPSSIYREGVEASKVLEFARAKVAKVLEAHADEIVFTSGGTEANNLAIKGVIASFGSSAKNVGNIGGNSTTVPHIISTKIEHPSVRDLLTSLEKDGKCTVTFLPVGESGVLDVRNFKKALSVRPDTALVSIMYVNNEIGTIQPIQEIAKVIRAHKKERMASVGASVSGVYPIFHTDACQAPQYLSLRIPTLGVDMMTLDGSKIYGPRGTGVLYKSRAVKIGKNISAQIVGGSQEEGLRAGTENVANASAFALALEKCQKGGTGVGDREGVKKDAQKISREYTRIAELRDKMLADILKAVPKARVNGAITNGATIESGKAVRVPNNINICVPGMDAEYAVLRLDAKGVCVSSVTSCRTKSEDASSYVIEEIYSNETGDKSELAKNGTVQNPINNLAEKCAKSSLRITLGKYTTEKEIKRATKIIIEVLTSML